MKEFLGIISPRNQKAVRLYREEEPIFSKYNLEEQIAQIFRKKVPLRSGGHLLFDPTEALVSIDVNSGRTSAEGAVEEMAYKVNLEAAVEIPRQLRLRDLGGLVVIDFIDMKDQRHAREVERRLKEEIKKDKAKITMGESPSSASLNCRASTLDSTYCAAPTENARSVREAALCGQQRQRPWTISVKSALPSCRKDPPF